MRLSEAIRLGSLVSHQRFATSADQTGRCALEAACDAIGVEALTSLDVFIVTQAEFPIGTAVMVGCPVNNGSPFCRDRDFLRNIIWHLNDQHKWARERIADWVELQEPLPLPETATTIEQLEEEKEITTK